jgi:ArsR family transcriptional regulator, arsenate/arsenite/antimonite-responsive transcriptional repressor
MGDDRVEARLTGVETAREDRGVAAGGDGRGPEVLCRQLKALAEPTRLGIIDLLMDGIQCNCEISARLGLSNSLISHHMRVLRGAGLVTSEPSPDDERWIFFSIDREVVTVLLAQFQRLLNPARMQPRAPSCGPQGGGCAPRR